jgi:hypothetical protein
MGTEATHPQAWSAGDFAAYLPVVRYRSKWYIDDSNGPLLFGLGIHGQYLFVDAERQLVVAKVSSEELPLDAARITSTLRAVSAKAIDMLDLQFRDADATTAAFRRAHPLPHAQPEPPPPSCRPFST